MATSSRSAYRAGDVIVVPFPYSDRLAQKRRPALVVSGDTLWQLARKYLGAGTRWTELLALNPTLQDPRRLQVGVQLVVHPTT